MGTDTNVPQHTPRKLSGDFRRKATPHSGADCSDARRRQRKRRLDSDQTHTRDERYLLTCRCIVKTTGKTGAEMEALTGVSVALLTVYDMCKALDKTMEIAGVRLLKRPAERAARSSIFSATDQIMRGDWPAPEPGAT